MVRDQYPDDPVLFDTFQELTIEEKGIFRDAFRQFDEASGITLIEVPAGLGDVKVGTFDFSAAGYDLAEYYGYYLWDMISIGQRFPLTEQTALHEIGHFVGLEHSFEGEYTLPLWQDTSDHTVMSYAEGFGQAEGLRSLDLQALQFLYGSDETDGEQVAKWSWDEASLTLEQVGFSDRENVIRGVGGNNLISAGPEADWVNILQGVGTNFIDLGAGDDEAVIVGFGGEHTVNGGDGDDLVIVPMEGRFHLDGGAGEDTVLISNAGLFSSHFSLAGALAGGNDFTGFELIGLWGGGGDDVLELSSEDGTIWGEAGADILKGGHGDDELFGQTGDDVLRGGSAADLLDGGDGNDRLNGGRGDDVLVGGGGADIFEFWDTGWLHEFGSDVIEDFDSREDGFYLVNGEFDSVEDTPDGALLQHGWSSILVRDVTGLSLEQWNSLILPFDDPDDLMTSSLDVGDKIYSSNAMVRFSSTFGPISLGTGTIELRTATGDVLGSWDVADYAGSSPPDRTLRFSDQGFEFKPEGLEMGGYYELFLPEGVLLLDGEPVRFDPDGSDFVASFQTQSAPEDHGASSFLLVAPDGWRGEVGGTGTIFGTGAQEAVTILSGSDISLDSSFNRGGDEIFFERDAAEFSVRRSGSTVIFSAEGFEVIVPVGLENTFVSFDGSGTYTLSYDPLHGEILLGGQVVTQAGSALGNGDLEEELVAASHSGTARLNLSDGAIVHVRGQYDIFGTGGEQVVEVSGSYQINLDPSFNRGGDVLLLNEEFTSIGFRRDGSTVTFEHSSGQQVRAPVGTAGLDVVFLGDQAVLRYDTELGDFYFGDRIFDTLPANGDVVG
ncbi:hypothetical protein B5C34_05990 [Pacificimonas flava]|uniref:Uncharacterized protein n=2 Tax=Pacificimonas TaxID=1960290 RepID=A0A219B4F7_9SPHN|nr:MULTISPECIES: hypothetical protein [Pacificimonas]MBZ6377226.1 hypothetical protein [Pacificimonas aurantium]OWV33054.1 hypothetical protein B5C34_05990 [Pacificimonas flava]